MSCPCRAVLISLAWVLLALAARSAAQADNPGTSYALLVGCSRYDAAELRELPYAGDDVRGFRDALLATGFDARHVSLLHDADGGRRPTRAVILDELGRLLERLGPRDTLVVALSGHGVQFQGDPVSYFVPADGRPAAPQTLLALTGEGGLYGRLRQCRAGRRLLLVNASRDGAEKAGGAAQARGEPGDEEPPGEQPPGCAAIFSCRAGQQSHYDPARKRSIFFDHLTRAWRGEYAAGGQVTLDSLMEQVMRRTRDDAFRQFEQGQVPVVLREYLSEWVITPRARPRPAAPASTDQVQLKAGPGTRIALVDGKFEVTSWLSARDPLDPEDKKFHCKLYQVELHAGRTYTIDMASPNAQALDPYLRLEDPNQVVLARDDDGGGFPNARIVFTAKATGPYVIVATTYAPQNTGRFTLSIRENK